MIAGLADFRADLIQLPPEQPIGSCYGDWVHDPGTDHLPRFGRHRYRLPVRFLHLRCGNRPGEGPVMALGHFGIIVRPSRCRRAPRFEH